MIIRGLDNIIAHLQKQHDKNKAEWYARSLDYGSTMQDYEDEIAGGRGLAHMFFDIPN